MKTVIHTAQVLLLAVLLFLNHQGLAQPTDITNTNGTFLCPGRSTIFSATGAQGGSRCSVLWAVTNGTTLQSNPTSAGIMTVAFADAPGDVATLQATFSDCSSTLDNGSTRVLTVYVRSITNQLLGALTLNGSTSGNIEFGSTAPVTLEVPYLTIPRNANDPQRLPAITAQGYEWTIPSGWAWPDGSISNGAPRLFNARSVSNPNRIQVTPPATACAGGGYAGGAGPSRGHRVPHRVGNRLSAN